MPCLLHHLRRDDWWPAPRVDDLGHQQVDALRWVPWCWHHHYRLQYALWQKRGHQLPRDAPNRVSSKQQGGELSAPTPQKSIWSEAYLHNWTQCNNGKGQPDSLERNSSQNEYEWRVGIFRVPWWNILRSGEARTRCQRGSVMGMFFYGKFLKCNETCHPVTWMMSWYKWRLRVRKLTLIIYESEDWSYLWQG